MSGEGGAPDGAVAPLRATADALEARAAELADGALAAMYAADPFWEARFGARGRRYAAEDGRFHVSYLAEALREGSPASLVAYARWLQGVLTTRGMCSLHLVHNFRRLAGAVAALAVPGAATAAAYLGEAAGALRYDGEAGAVHDLAVAADEAAAPRADLAAHLLSYLADAVALGRPPVFTDHVRWLRENAERLGHAGSDVRTALAAVDRRLAAAPGTPVAAAIARMAHEPQARREGASA